MLNLIKRNIDKVYHAIAGLIIALLVGYFFTWQIGFASAAFIGIAKEIWDHFSPKGTADIWDFVWTVIGGGIGSVILFVNTWFLMFL